MVKQSMGHEEEKVAVVVRRLTLQSAGLVLTFNQNTEMLELTS
ncbi:MAG: hypothetical protein DID89_2727548118 [Candidatus Nitrotoga sp. CP45]|nr:MAG: hypothetical protein DID89_2727548118 [Candidatus Nitrotoga sp. CP45]